MWLCPWSKDSLFEGFGSLAMDGLRVRRKQQRGELSNPRLQPTARRKDTRRG